MYEVGDLIVYGRTGICEVTEITTLKMNGVPKDKLYYILRPVREKHGKVFTPVDNEKIVMRKVISKEEADIDFEWSARVGFKVAISAFTGDGTFD